MSRMEQGELRDEEESPDVVLLDSDHESVPASDEEPPRASPHRHDDEEELGPEIKPPQAKPKKEKHKHSKHRRGEKKRGHDEKERGDKYGSSHGRQGDSHRGRPKDERDRGGDRMRRKEERKNRDAGGGPREAAGVGRDGDKYPRDARENIDERKRSMQERERLERMEKERQRLKKERQRIENERQRHQERLENREKIERAERDWERARRAQRQKQKEDSDYNRATRHDVDQRRERDKNRGPKSRSPQQRRHEGDAYRRGDDREYYRDGPADDRRVVERSGDRSGSRQKQQQQQQRDYDRGGAASNNEHDDDGHAAPDERNYDDQRDYDHQRDYGDRRRGGNSRNRRGGRDGGGEGEDGGDDMASRFEQEMDDDDEHDDDRHEEEEEEEEEDRGHEEYEEEEREPRRRATSSSEEHSAASASESESDSNDEEDRRKHRHPGKVKSKFESESEEEESDAHSAEDEDRHDGREADSDQDGADYIEHTPPESPVELAPDLPPYLPAIQGCRNVEEFRCLNRIEEGTYGVVYRAQDKKTEETVALKRLKMEKEKEGFPITSLREINTLLKAQHVNIVTVREIVVGSNMDRIYIVMDYVEHDLKSLMEIMKEDFLIGEVKTLMIQLLRGVAHLHDNWIIHRDLKTSNLLFSHSGILKIGDFGLAREYGSPLKQYTPIVVTLWYRSPELLLACKEYSTAVDMWSVGCIMAEFLTRKPLFPGKSEIDLLNRIFKDLGTPNEKIWPGLSKLKGWQSTTFAEYPYNKMRERLGANVSDSGFDIANKFLTYDPKRRISAEKALKHDWFKESPHPVDPSMFPTWPAKSEQSRRTAHGNSPKPPSGGKAYSRLMGEEDEGGFHLGGQARNNQGPGFALKF